jgi:hypothetical protein
MKKKELQQELRELAARHEALAEAVRRLAAHTDVLAVALRSPEAVSPADLDAAISGIHDVHSQLIREGVVL